MAKARHIEPELNHILNYILKLGLKLGLENHT